MSRFAGTRAAVSRQSRTQSGYPDLDAKAEQVSSSVSAQKEVEPVSRASSSQSELLQPRVSLQQYSSIEPPEQYLKRFGYGVEGISPQLFLHVMGHEENCGHTFYELQCSLAWNGCGNEAYVSYLRGPPLTWRCKHRLQDLRENLHDPVKETLNGVGGYDTLFEGVPFARYGGLPGTTSRLRAWFAALAKCANTFPPELCARMLRFLEAPVPPNSDAALLMTAGRCIVCTLPLELVAGSSVKVCNRCSADSSIDCNPRSPNRKSKSSNQIVENGVQETGYRPSWMKSSVADLEDDMMAGEIRVS